MADRLPPVLIVDGEAHVRRALMAMLKRNGYATLEVATGAEALETVRRRLVSLVLLELALPDFGGAEVTTRIRRSSAIPIIVVSSCDEQRTKIDLLDRGANDYVTKPFEPGELLARMRAAMRSKFVPSERPPISLFKVGDLEVDLAHRQVRRGTTEVHLTPYEFDLLRVLIENAGFVVGHRELLQTVWGPRAVGETHYLRVYMRHLRLKLEAEPTEPRYLTTIAGVGYRLTADA